MTIQSRHQRSGSAAASAADRHRPRHATHPETRPMPPVRPDILDGDFYGDEDQIARGGLGYVERVLFTAVCILLATVVVVLVVVNVHRSFGVVGDLALAVVVAAVVRISGVSVAVHR